MTSKGFTENTNNIETPNDINVTEKPLNSNKIIKKEIFRLNLVAKHKMKK